MENLLLPTSVVGYWRPDMINIPEVNQSQCVAFHTSEGIGIAPGQKRRVQGLMYETI
ncbi:hypothetical protein DPMN_042625 [Dreissena polymorpha]|uniref:Uncharacterized protein n=1 Tax=Dreissena polymorpha TaxID=45954 RepID=A0A9D4CZW3_DREPO|nr:hypothetical protein DPMN_042625 [Dreissena polymorpha]